MYLKKHCPRAKHDGAPSNPSDLGGDQEDPCLRPAQVKS
jgi:hypothetical protein